MRNYDTERVLENAMTVRQLIEELEGFDADAPVMFAVNYGDYGNTIQALPVKDVDPAERRMFSDTAYSRSGVEYRSDDPDECVYCKTCEKELAFTTCCPYCDGDVVTDEGEPVDRVEGDDDGTEIVVLQM